MALRSVRAPSGPTLALSAPGPSTTTRIAICTPLRATLGYTQAGHGAGVLHGASAKANPVKTLDRLRRDTLIPAIPPQGKSTWSHCIGLSGCPGVPGWKGPRNRSGVQIV